MLKFSKKIYEQKYVHMFEQNMAIGMYSVLIVSVECV